MSRHNYSKTSPAAERSLLRKLLALWTLLLPGANGNITHGRTWGISAANAPDRTPVPPAPPPPAPPPPPPERPDTYLSATPPAKRQPTNVLNEFFVKPNNVLYASMKYPNQGHDTSVKEVHSSPSTAMIAVQGKKNGRKRKEKGVFRNIMLSPIHAWMGVSYLHKHYLDIARLVFSRAMLVQLVVLGLLGATDRWGPELVQEVLLAFVTRALGVLYWLACCYTIPSLAVAGVILGPPLAVASLLITKGDFGPIVSTASDYWQRLIGRFPTLKDFLHDTLVVAEHFEKRQRDIQTTLFGSIIPRQPIAQHVFMLLIIPLVEGFIWRFMFDWFRRTWTRLMVRKPIAKVATKHPESMFDRVKVLIRGIKSLIVYIVQGAIIAFSVLLVTQMGLNVVNYWKNSMDSLVDPFTLWAGSVGFGVIAVFAAVQPLFLFSNEDDPHTEQAVFQLRRQDSNDSYPRWIVFSSMLAAATHLYHWYSHQDLLYGQVNIYEARAVPRLAYALAHLTTSYLMNVEVFWPLYLTKGFAASFGAHAAWNAVGFKPRTMPIFFAVNILARLVFRILVVVPGRWRSNDNQENLQVTATVLKNMGDAQEELGSRRSFGAPQPWPTQHRKTKFDLKPKPR